MKDSDVINQRLAELAEQFVLECQEGKAPKINSYARDHPELAERIRSLFPALEIVEELGPLSDSSRTEEHSSLDSLTNKRSPEGEYVPKTLGDFEIVDEIGRGGMGVVYRAEQRSLRRAVALKILPQHPTRDVQSAQRFKVEAQSAARLHHHHIVPVFEVGEANGYSFYAMQLIEGQSLESVIRELRQLQGVANNSAKNQTTDSPILTSVLYRVARSNSSKPSTASSTENGDAKGKSTHLSEKFEVLATEKDIDRKHEMGNTRDASTSTPSRTEQLLSTSTAVKSRSHFHRSVASIGLQVARGLAYAHEQEILHRDIKPSNLLIDEFLNAWITDFGLAKPIGTDLTNTGDVVGTINYMAPERFHGWADPRSDVYSLGITLYELLTLRAAYESNDRFALIRSISSSDPPKTHLVEKRRPTDLDTIIHKAMEREPADRYASAKDMADDLERFLNGQSISARRSGRFEQISRMCRRNPWTTLLVLTLLLSLVMGTIISILLWREESNQRSIAETNQEIADEQRRVAWQAVDDYFTKVSQQRLLEIPGGEHLRRELLLLAVQYYERFVDEHIGDERLQRELANTHLRLGQLYRLVDSRERSQVEFEKALQLARENHAAFQGLESDVAVARALNELGYVAYERGELESALDRFDEAIELMDQHDASNSSNDEMLRLYSDILTNKGSSLQFQPHQHQSRDELFDLALTIRKRQFQISGNPECQLDVVAAYNNLIASLVTSGELDRAQAVNEEALVLRTEAELGGAGSTRDDELNGDALHNLAVLAHRHGQHSSAIKHYKTALSIRQRLYGWQPNNREFRSDLAQTGSNLVGVYREVGCIDLAIKLGLATLVHWHWLIERDPDIEFHRDRLIQLQLRLSNLYQSKGQIPEARSLLSELIEFIERRDLTIELSSDDFARYCDAKRRHVLLDRIVTSDDEVEIELRQLLESLQSYADESNKSKLLLDSTYELYVALAETTLSRGQVGDARQYLLAASEVSDQQGELQDGAASISEYRAKCFFVEGLIELKAKEWITAEIAFRNAIEIWHSLHKDQPEVLIFKRRIAKGRRDLANSFLGQQKQSDAIEELLEAIKLLEELRGTAPAQMSHHVDLIEALHQLGYVYSMNRQYTESRRVAGRSVEVIEELPESIQRQPTMKRNLAMNLTLLGAALLAEGNAQGAYNSFDRAELTYRELLNQDSSNPRIKTHLAGTRCNAALALRRLDREKEALALYTLAGELLESLQRDGIASLEAIEFLEKSLTGRAELLVELGQPQTAIVHLRQSQELLTQLRDELPSNAVFERRMERVDRLVEQARELSGQ